MYSYIHQAYFDGKKQPKLKKFFSVNFKKRDSETASTSTEITRGESKSSKQTTDTKVDKNKTKMEVESNFFDTDDDDDIIPATPPPVEVHKFKKNFLTNKSKLTNEEIIQKLPKTNIIELIESIDGTPGHKINKEDTFLSEIENLSKKIKVGTSDEESPEIIETSQEFEIESTTSKRQSSSVNENFSSSSVSETKASKKLISDYFQKSFRGS